MTTYSEMTQQFGDQWIAVAKQAEDAVTDGIGRLTSLVDLPKLPLTDQFNEVVTANFALAERLLVAQRDLTVRLLGAAPAKADEKSDEKSEA